MCVMLLIMNTSVRLTWIMYMVTLTSSLGVCCAYLLRVGSILTSSNSSWTSTRSSCSSSWLIDTNELVNKVIESLFVISLWELLITIVVQILV